MKILLYISFLSCFLPCGAQKILPVKEMRREDYISASDSLFEKFGNNKTFLPDYELACLVALSYYPELAEPTIIFRRSQFQTTMSAAPQASFLVTSRAKRVYYININEKAKFTGPKLSELTFNQQVGVIGHELAHVLFYTRSSMPVVVLFGFRYMYGDQRLLIESNTDKTTIKHNLGWQLYDFVHLVHDTYRTQEKYIAVKSKFYLDDNEILELVKQAYGAN